MMATPFAIGGYPHPEDTTTNRKLINNQSFVFAHEHIIHVTDKVSRIFESTGSSLSLEDAISTHMGVVSTDRRELLLRPLDNVSTQEFLNSLIAQDNTFELFSHGIQQGTDHIQYSNNPQEINVNAYFWDIIHKQFRGLLSNSKRALKLNTSHLTIEILEADPRIPEIKKIEKKKFYAFIENLEYACCLGFRFAVDDIDATPGNFGRYILDELKKIGKQDLISDIKVSGKVIRKLVDSNYNKMTHEMRFFQSLKDKYP